MTLPIEILEENEARDLIYEMDLGSRFTKEESEGFCAIFYVYIF